jgi:hypothetical protein
MSITKPGLVAATGHADAINSSVLSGNLEVGGNISVDGSVTTSGITANQYNIQLLFPIQGISFASGSGLGVTGSFNLDKKSNCLFFINSSGYSTTANAGITTECYLDSTTLIGSYNQFTNEANSHKHMAFTTTATVDAGSHSVSVKCLRFTDSTDRATVSIIAIPTP